MIDKHQCKEGQIFHEATQLSLYTYLKKFEKHTCFLVFFCESRRGCSNPTWMRSKSSVVAENRRWLPRQVGRSVFVTSKIWVTRQSCAMSGNLDKKNGNYTWPPHPQVLPPPTLESYILFWGLNPKCDVEIRYQCVLWWWKSCIETVGRWSMKEDVFIFN